MKITSGHTYYTQLLCHSLFNRMGDKDQGSLVTVEDVEGVIGEAIERATVNLKFVWDDSPFTEQLALLAVNEAISDGSREVTEDEILRVLTRQGIGLSRGDVTTALRSLVGREVLSGTDTYTFSVDLMRRWLRENQRIEWLDQQLLEEVRQAHPVTEVVEAPPTVRRSRGLFVGVGIAALIAVGVVGGAVLVLSLLGDSGEVQGPSLSATEPRIAPTATPAPRADPVTAGVYTVGRCGLPPLNAEQRTWVELCVNSVEVRDDGQLVFQISWGARIGEGVLTSGGSPATALQKPSDIGNTNMYVTDNLGNRYDFTDLGGAASEDTIIRKDENVEGWFLFPPPHPDAKLFTFHDDDNFWAIAGVSLENVAE